MLRKPSSWKDRALPFESCGVLLAWAQLIARRSVRLCRPEELPHGGSRNAKCIPSRSALKHSPHPIFCFNWSKEDPTLQEQKFLITACHHVLKNKSERRASPRIKHTFKSPTVINHSITKRFKTVKISIPILTVCWWGKGDWSSRSQSILVIFYLVYACMRQKLNKASNKI